MLSRTSSRVAWTSLIDVAGELTARRPAGEAAQGIAVLHDEVVGEGKDLLPCVGETGLQVVLKDILRSPDVLHTLGQLAPPLGMFLPIASIAASPNCYSRYDLWRFLGIIFRESRMKEHSYLAHPIEKPYAPAQPRPKKAVLRQLQIGGFGKGVKDN